VNCLVISPSRSSQKSFDVRNLALLLRVVERRSSCGETVEVPYAATQLLNKILVGRLARWCGKGPALGMCLARGWTSEVHWGGFFGFIFIYYFFFFAGELSSALAMTADG
jgi:hypothetical protein